MGGTGRRALLAPVVAVVLAAGVACDAQSGIPTEQPPADTVSTPPAAVAPDTTTPPPAPMPQVVVGDVPVNPAAADAVRAWATDLVTRPDTVPARCWTLPPAQAAHQYADTAAILGALSRPGVDGQFAVSWTDGGTTVSVKRSEIASGYACPHVHPAGTPDFYTPADAEYAVTRFLSRESGAPVNRADTETAYPLICPGFSPWDPSGTGAGGQPPLKSDPDVLAGTTAFAADAMTATQGRGDYLDVSVPVTDVSGATETKRITLSIGPDGYCLGEVT
jgi:hypothetical protein